jgi:hypothetical protein
MYASAKQLTLWIAFFAWKNLVIRKGVADWQVESTKHRPTLMSELLDPSSIA